VGGSIYRDVALPKSKRQRNAFERRQSPHVAERLVAQIVGD
jgi:hypothetical protein